MPELPASLEGMYEPILYGLVGVLGLVSWFFGFRLFKIILVAIMAVAGAAGLAYLGFYWGEAPVLWSAGGLVLGAILGGVLAYFFYSLSVATLAALFVATTILPWLQPYGLGVQWGVLAVACTLAALVAVSLSNLTIQLGSAMIGALMLLHSGRYFLTGETVHHAIEEEGEWALYLDMDPLLAGAGIALGLIGFFLQRRAANK